MLSHTSRKMIHAHAHLLLQLSILCQITLLPEFIILHKLQLFRCPPWLLSPHTFSFQFSPLSCQPICIFVSMCSITPLFLSLYLQFLVFYKNLSLKKNLSFVVFLTYAIHWGQEMVRLAGEWTCTPTMNLRCFTRQSTTCIIIVIYLLTI